MSEEHVLKHGPYRGSIEFSHDDNIFHGRVLNITDMVTYEGESLDALEKDFKESVDEYLVFCQEIGHCPETC